MWCVVSPSADPVAINDVAGVIRMLRECHDSQALELARTYRDAIATALDDARNLPYITPNVLQRLLHAVQRAEAQAEHVTGIRLRWPFVADIRLNPWEAEPLIAEICKNYRCHSPTVDELVRIADAMSSWAYSHIPHDEKDARDMARALYDALRAPWQRESRLLPSGAVVVGCNGYDLREATSIMLDRAEETP